MTVIPPNGFSDASQEWRRWVEDNIIDTGRSVTRANNSAQRAVGASNSALAVGGEGLNNSAAAVELADFALTSANGRNKNYYSATMPVPSEWDVETFNVGDTWYNTALDNQMSIWEADQWVVVQWGENAISDLSISNAKIKDATIQSAKIANLDAGKITTGKLDAGRINGIEVVGMTIKTAESGQRMQFDINGLKAYNSAEQVTAALSAADGGLTLSGNIITQSGTSRTFMGPGQVTTRQVSSNPLDIQPYSRLQSGTSEYGYVSGVGDAEQFRSTGVMTPLGITWGASETFTLDGGMNANITAAQGVTVQGVNIRKTSWTFLSPANASWGSSNMYWRIVNDVVYVQGTMLCNNATNGNMIQLPTTVLPRLTFIVPIIRYSSGAGIVNTQMTVNQGGTFGVWSPTAGQTYYVNISWPLT